MKHKEAHSGYANARRESLAVSRRWRGRDALDARFDGRDLGQELGSRDAKGRSLLPDAPVSHAHTIRSYLGEDVFARLTAAVKPGRRRTRKAEQ